MITAPNIANTICYANTSCGDAPTFFAYRGAVKSEPKSPEHAKVGHAIYTERKAKGWSQDKLAELVGVKSRQVVQSWEAGKSMPKPAEMRKLAAIFRNDDLRAHSVIALAPAREDRALYDVGHVARVPIISWVAASAFCGSADPYPVGNGEGYTFVPGVSDRCYALRVRGPSMQPRFSDGDLIVVDPQREAKPGDFVVVARDAKEEATFKELARVDGALWLKPLNQQFPAIPMPTDARICGVVVRRIEEF